MFKFFKKYKECKCGAGKEVAVNFQYTIGAPVAGETQNHHSVGICGKAKDGRKLFNQEMDLRASAAEMADLQGQVLRSKITFNNLGESWTPKVCHGSLKFEGKEIPASATEVNISGSGDRWDFRIVK